MTDAATNDPTPAQQAAPSVQADASAPSLLALSVMLGQLGVAAKPSNLRQRLGRDGGLDLKDAAFLAREHYQFKPHRHKNRPKARRAEQQLQRLPAPCLGFDGQTLQVFLGLEAGGDGEPSMANFFDPKTKTVARVALDQALMRLGKQVLTFKDMGQSPREDFSLLWIFRQMFSRQAALTQVLLSSVFIQVFALITPLFTMVIIDKIFSSTANAHSTLQVLLIALVAVALFDFMIGFTRKLLLNHVLNQVDVTLMVRLFRRLTQLPMAHYNGKATGDTVARMKDVEGIRSFMSSSALASIIDLPFGLLFLGVMALFSVQLAVIVAISIAVTFLLYGLIGPFLKERIKKQQAMSGDSQSFLIESVTSMETIKSMSAENRFQRQWEDLLAQQTSFGQGSEAMTSLVGQLGQLINKVTLALTLLVGAGLVIAGDMTAGQLIAFNMLVGRVSAPAHRIASMLQATQQFFASIKRVQQLYNAAPEPAYMERRSSLPDMGGALLLDHVSFRYSPDGPLVLDDVSFEVGSGEVVGIVGSSGSGKSTLVRLLQRLAVPTAGSVYIDGVNIAQVDPVWLRTQVGSVLQDNLLFNRSIRDNITIADPAIGQDEVERVAKLAGADAFIKQLPQSYDTPVGERGELLSTGQRQRIAIARALVTDPKVLIFDEATASLDYEAEKVFQDNLEIMAQGRTVIIVAHRLSTLRIADRILTLENGRLIEDGSPQSLLRSGGRFAQLFALHTGRLPSGQQAATRPNTPSPNTPSPSKPTPTAQAANGRAA